MQSKLETVLELALHVRSIRRLISRGRKAAEIFESKKISRVCTARVPVELRMAGDGVLICSDV